MKEIKKKIFLLVLFVSTTFCFGEQISIQIVQHNNSVENVTEEALVVEDALISEFFEKGYIVTNSPAALSRSAEDDSSLWTQGINEVVNSGADYFLQVILNFTEEMDEKINKNVLVLKTTDFSLYSVKSVKEVEKGTFNCNLKINDFSDMAIISDSLIFEILKVLNA